MLALALVMIYRATHHVNFGQGEMAMFSTYIAGRCSRPACRTGSQALQPLFSVSLPAS